MVFEDPRSLGFPTGPPPLHDHSTTDALHPLFIEVEFDPRENTDNVRQSLQNVVGNRGAGPGARRSLSEPHSPTVPTEENINQESDTMPICLITTNPQENAEQYEKVMSHLRDSGPVPPEGARLLIAGQGPEGWRAVSVWDDPQALQCFFGGRLTAAYHAARVSPEATIQQTFEIHSLIAPELTPQA